MLRKKQVNQLANKKLDLYIKSNNLPKDIISDLIKFVRHSPHLLIKAHITSHLKTIQCIKWFILLHNLNFVQIKNKQSQIQSLIQLVNPNSIESQSFDSILCQKMIKPYKAYLLKRNTFNLKEIDPQFHCFALINMLKLGLSFTNIIFTLGRYLYKKYNFLIQFNIIMAKDLYYLYKSLKYKMDEDFKVQNIQIIQQINQGMYSIYYNCYFNKYVSYMAPDWIDVDLSQTISLRQISKVSKVFSKTQLKTQKYIKSNRLEVELEHQVSIAMDQSSLQLKDQLKSISTIASHRQSEVFDEIESNKKQRENKERKEFIFMAESILQSFRENEEEVNQYCCTILVYQILSYLINQNQTTRDISKIKDANFCQYQLNTD